MAVPARPYMPTAIWPDGQTKRLSETLGLPASGKLLVMLLVFVFQQVKPTVLTKGRLPTNTSRMVTTALGSHRGLFQGPADVPADGLP